MRQFSYEAIDPLGKKITASGEAMDRETMQLNLQAKGLVLIRWLDKDLQQKPIFKLSTRTMKRGELLQITKDMAHLLKSNIPMDKALTIIADSARKESMKTMALSLKEAIQGGSTFSEALSTKSNDFTDFYVNMIRVGEMGGILPQVMEKLAQFMEKTQEIRKFIVSSSIYPIILLSIGVLSVFVIMGFVVPRFASIFSDLGQDIPMATKLLIQISEFLRTWGWLILISIAIIVWLLWRFAHSRQGKEFVDRLIIRLPFFGLLNRDIQVSRFSRTLGTLIISGVPLLKALTITQDIVENNVIKRAIVHIYEQVKEGKRISVLMQKQEIFPAMAVQMVSLGEETGRLGEMLVLVAEELDNIIQSRIKISLAFLEPATILLMGLIIGGIVISMLSAIFGINDIQF